MIEFSTDKNGIFSNNGAVSIARLRMKDIYKLLAEKRKVLEQVQREVDALTVAANLLRGEEPPSNGTQSQPQMVVAILEAHAKPMHVNKIVDELRKRFKITVKKSNLGVLLYRYAQRGKNFYKVPNRPNTYGLIKWQAMATSQNEHVAVQ
jgi:hypothetical protein